MIYLKGIYDSSSKCLLIEFKSSLLASNFELLESCVKENISSGRLPEDLTVKDLGDSRCLISLHVDLPQAKGLKDGQRMGPLPKNITDKISGVLEIFRNRAMKKEFSTTEFIPLSGYPVEDLQKDIHEAIKNKRDFCIIDKYSEYLRFSKGDTTKLKQKKLKFLSNEYSDAAIYIYEGNMKKLKDMFKDELTIREWE